MDEFNKSLYIATNSAQTTSAADAFMKKVDVYGSRSCETGLLLKHALE